MNITTHAAVRCGQRGFRETDLELIARYGTATDEGYLLTRKDVKEAECRFKRLLDRLTRLQDAFISTTDDGRTTKTVFRATRKQRRRQTGRW